MSLTDLANELKRQAESGNITLNAQTLEAAHLTPPADLDRLIQDSFKLGTGSNLQITISPQNIPNPTDEGKKLTLINGKATLLNVEADNTSITIVFNSPDAQAVNFTIQVELTNWQFSTSFPFMGGYPFQELPISEPSFVFATEKITDWSWNNAKINLEQGLNFASHLTLSNYFSPVLEFLSEGFNPDSKLNFFGFLDVKNVDNENILFPDLDLKAKIIDRDIPPIAPFLKVNSPYVELIIESIEEEEEGIIQTPNVYFGVNLEVSRGTDIIALDFQTQIIKDSSSFLLVITSEPEHPLTLESVFALMAGNSWYAFIPKELQQFLSAIVFQSYVTRIALGNPKTILDVGVIVGAKGISRDQPWQLFNSDNFVIYELDTNWSILLPETGGPMIVRFSAQFGFFPGVFDGVFDFQITNQLYMAGDFDGELSLQLSDFVSLVAGSPIDIPVNFSIDFSNFSAYLDYRGGNYGMGATASAELDILGTEIIKLQDVSFSLDVYTSVTSDQRNAQRAIKAVNPPSEALTIVEGGNTKKYQAVMNGVFFLGFVVLSFNSQYSTDDGWIFNANTLTPIDIGQIIQQLLNNAALPTWLKPDLIVKNIAISVVAPHQPKKGIYTLAAEVEWKAEIGAIEIDTDAKFSIQYDDNQVDDSKYSGVMSADITIEQLNAEVLIAYAFSPNVQASAIQVEALVEMTDTEIEAATGVNQKISVTWEGFTSTYETESNTITFQVGEWSFGEIITALLKLVTGAPSYSLPTPWDVLNQISLKGFEIVFNLATKQATVNYKLPKPVKLFFITINGFDFTKDENGRVEISLDAQLLIGDRSGDQIKWNAADSSDGPPAVPGGGSQYFDLRLLALGQHVSIEGASSFTSVNQAITALRTFQASDPNQIPIQKKPVDPGQPVFDENSNWLIGADFGILKISDGQNEADSTEYGIVLAAQQPQYVVNLQVIFNDPNFYGLRIALGGEQAKIFAGLDFEIMYRKVTDSIGVYSLQLTLPDAMRYLEFGAVSVILPVVGIEIYTNGNFKVDFGFPYNLDFSVSFGLQIFPFTGAGGFYFALLSGETSTKVPQTTKGTFNPVIELGIGFQVGLGKDISKGILKAGIDITVFGILEGVIATWHPEDGNLVPGSQQQIQGDYYYLIKGTLGIIGKIYGSVDFAIIKAELSVVVRAFIQATIESFRPLFIYLEAGISVSLSVKINLGLFKIRIHLSFSTTIKESFTLGKREIAPWDSTAMVEAFIKTGLQETLYIQPQWQPLVMDGGKVPLTIYFAPHLAIAGNPTGSLTDQQAQYVAMLYIDSPMPADANGNSSSDDTGETSFEKLAKEVFAWAVVAFSREGELTSRTALMSDILSRQQIQAAFDYLSHPDVAQPISYEQQLKPFLMETFTIDICAPTNLESATVFAMIPDLQLYVPSYKGSQEVNVHFDGSDGSVALIDEEYMETLQAYFNQLMVQHQNELEKKYQDGTSRDENVIFNIEPETVPTQSFPTFIFEDYFLMIAKHTLQAAIDGLKNYNYQLNDQDSITSILGFANQFGQGDNKNNLTAKALANLNKNHPLTGGKNLSVEGVKYQVQDSQSLNAIANLYSSNTALSILQIENNQSEQMIQPNVTFTIEKEEGNISYTTKSGDTIGIILEDLQAEQVSLEQLVQTIQDLNNILIPLSILEIPPITYTTTNDTANPDSLEKVAAIYNVTPASIAETEANQQVSGLFLNTAPNDYLDLPDLTYLDVEHLFADMEATHSLDHLSGMAARFLLHGMRPPINDHIKLPEGSPCSEENSCALYDLTGQQFVLPKLTNEDANQYVINLQKDSSITWINFIPAAGVIDSEGDSEVDKLPVPIGNEDINEINALLNSAITIGIKPDVIQLKPLPLVEKNPRRYSFKSNVPIQSPAPISLPIDGSSNQINPTPYIWNFSRGFLQELGIEKAVNPKFSLKISSQSDPNRPPQERTATNYGWGTLFTLSLKRLPIKEGSLEVFPNTYEIIGTNDVGITLLERLLGKLDTVGNNEIDDIYIFYRPNQSGESKEGLQTDGMSNVSSFVVQGNLSTETNPIQSTFSLFLAEAENQLTGIINTPQDFLQLIWEASIVRSGGFYLYYETGKDKTGLPDYLFNEKDTGDISILVIYKEINDLLTSYMNCGITGDNIDTANDMVFAEAAAQTVSYTVTNTPENPDSLESIANNYHIHLTDVVLQNGNQPLNLANPQPLAINNIYHEVGVTESGNVETLAAIASHFKVTETAIKAANPSLEIDWDNVPVFTLLRIPDIQYQVTADGPLKTWAEIASYYGVSLSSLGWDNRQIDSIFAINTKLSIEDWSTDKTATLLPGNVGFTLERQNPGDNDDSAVYLLTQYNLLGYQVADNISFTMSNEGLPVGPADQLDKQGVQDAVRQQPRLAESTQPWQYQQVFPVYPFAKFNPLESTNDSLPDPTMNPYAGVGEALQVHFAWQDLFGNQTITSLSEPKLAPDQPLNNLPIQIGYTDKLLALAQWPSVMPNYIFQIQNGKKSLVINLQFDLSRYEQNNQLASNSSNADDLPTWQKNALADRLIYSQLYYQISQTDKEENPTINFVVQTSLDREQQHVLTDDNLTKMKNFVIAAYQYLSSLLPDGNPTSPPVDQQLLLEIDDCNSQNIFELTVLFSIQRQEQQIADDFKDAVSVVSSQTYLSPLTKKPQNGNSDSNGEDDTHQLSYFAEQFETTYRFDNYYLKIAVGMSRFDVADSQESKTIWVVQLATDASSTLYYQIQGEAIFYAPRPLSNSPISRTVPIINYDSFDPSKPLEQQIPQSKAFSGVDLDVWARQTLEAIDLFLSPQFAIPAFMVDKLSTPNTTYFKTILDAKGKLADAIKTTVYNILDNPDIDPNSNNLQDAREKLRQQLLIKLVNVYDIDAIVQYNVEVNSPYADYTDTNNTAPRIYGQPIGEISTPPADRPIDGKSDTAGNAQSTNQTYSLSTAKIPLNKEKSYFSFAFSTKNIKNQANFNLDLSYQITNLEHEIGSVERIEGYQASSWLSFVVPLEVIKIAKNVEIPVLLRAYPSPPSLLNQEGISSTQDSKNTSETLEKANLWNYQYTYKQLQAAQDIIESQVKFNIPLGGSFEAFLAEEIDLFTALAQFVSAYPQIEESFLKYLTSITLETVPTSEEFQEASKALNLFSKLVDRLAVPWQNWHETNNALMLQQEEAANAEIQYQFSIKEQECNSQKCVDKVDGGKDLPLIVTVTPDGNNPESTLPIPILIFDGYIPEAYEGEEYPPNSTLYYKEVEPNGRTKKKVYLTWTEARTIADRFVNFSSLDVLAYQNAWAAVKITRNQGLVPNNPTRQMFVYETPQVRFANKLTPLLDNDAKIDIAKIKNSNEAQNLPLEQHLQNLFSTFFKNAAIPSAIVKLECSYYYILEDNANLSAAPISLPIVLVTPALFQIPDDWAVPQNGCPNIPTGDTSFVCKLTNAIQGWYSRNQPKSDKGTFLFDISVFSRLNDTQLPLIRLRNVVLNQGNITNLT